MLRGANKMQGHITIRNMQEYVKKRDYNPGIDGKLGMMLKFTEECGELAQAMLKNYPHAQGDNIKDTIEEEFYDVLYCLCGLANLYDVDIEKWIPAKAREADKKWNTPHFFEENFVLITRGD
jgi:NTP pyrophosphatase (non-canonical NTP hydrolase)